jgi:hypothetical protein
VRLNVASKMVCDALMDANGPLNLAATAQYILKAMNEEARVYDPAAS